jgi:hypothetical protein
LFKKVQQRQLEFYKECPYYSAKNISLQMLGAECSVKNTVLEKNSANSAQESLFCQSSASVRKRSL